MYSEQDTRQYAEILMHLDSEHIFSYYLLIDKPIQKLYSSAAFRSLHTRRVEMAPKIKISGTVDKQPLPAKVHDALTSTIEKEFTLRPPHHLEITHIDITWEKTAV
jgi:hypothetical protein